MRYSRWHKMSQSCASCWLIQKYCEPVLLCNYVRLKFILQRFIDASAALSLLQSSKVPVLLWFLVVPTTSHFYGPPFRIPFPGWVDPDGSRWIQMAFPVCQALGSLGLGHRAHELQDALQVFTVPQLREKQLTRKDGMLENGWKMLGDVGDGKCYRVNCTASVQIVHSVKLWLFDSVRESPRWWEVAGLWQLLAASGLAFRWWTSTSLALHHGIATWSAQLSDVCSGDKSCSYLKHVS